MNFQEIITIGKKFSLDQEQSIGLCLSMISSFDDFIRTENERKINFFKRERLSRKEKKFLSSVLNNFFLKNLIKYEQTIVTKEVLSEKKRNPIVNELKRILFSPSNLRKDLESEGVLR